jgi:exodeoxyribonuclease VII small subunit
MAARKDDKAVPSPAADPEPTSFDERLERLEAIVSELEGGELGLEGAIARYRDGVGLLKACRAQLDGYRRQVEELSGEAAATLAPYAGDPDVGSGR